MMTSRENLFDQYWVWIETPGTPLPPKRDSFLRLRRNDTDFAGRPLSGRNRRNGGWPQPRNPTMITNRPTLPDSSGCPFFDRQQTDCRINPSPVLADERSWRYCSGDRHEDCPTLLVFLLRNSVPPSRHCSREEFLDK